jgi:hypothetical protein
MAKQVVYGHRHESHYRRQWYGREMFLKSRHKSNLIPCCVRFQVLTAESTPRERKPGIHCTEGLVGPRAGLDTEVRGKILLPLTGTCIARSPSP